MYCNRAIFVELAGLLIIFIFEFYKKVLKKEYYKEFVESIKQALMLLLVLSLYLVTVQDGNDYSRMALFAMVAIYGVTTYSVHLLQKFLQHRMKNGEEISLVIVTSQKNAKDVVGNLKKNYNMYKLTGVMY